MDTKEDIKIVNLTPHPIVIINGEDSIKIEPSGELARCQTTRKVVGTLSINGIDVPATKTEFGEVVGLPEPKENVAYIVSALVAQACPTRSDLCIPDDSVRDNEGKIIGCRALSFSNKTEELELEITKTYIPEYDLSKSHDGGSYRQPSYCGEFSDGTKCFIEDTSCGDFGTRIFVELEYPDGKKYSSYYGSMLSQDEKYSDFTEEDVPYLRLIQEELGYHAPLTQDIEFVNRLYAQERD